MSPVPLFQVVEGKEELDSFAAMELGGAELVIDASKWTGWSSFFTSKPDLTFEAQKEPAGRVTSSVDVLEYIERLVEVDGLGTLILTAKDWLSVDARTLASALELISNVNRGPYGTGRPVSMVLIVRTGDLATAAE